MKHSLQLKLGQHLTLTPQLQQSIRLLQLSTLELNQELEQMLQDNPLLEREDEEDEASHAAAEAPAHTAEAEAQSTETPAARKRRIRTGDRAGRLPTGTTTARPAAMTKTATTRKARFRVRPCANTC